MVLSKTCVRQNGRTPRGYEQQGAASPSSRLGGQATEPYEQKNTAIAVFGPQLNATAGAFVGELARIGPHRFRLRSATLRTGYDGSEYHHAYCHKNLSVVVGGTGTGKTHLAMQSPEAASDPVPAAASSEETSATAKPRRSKGSKLGSRCGVKFGSRLTFRDLG